MVLGGPIIPGGVPGPQMGAGLPGPSRVINPVQQQQRQKQQQQRQRQQPPHELSLAIEREFAFVAPADVVARPRRRRPRGLFSHPIRPRKSDQAGIDGVGEHRGEHRVPESERR